MSIIDEKFIKTFSLPRPRVDKRHRVEMSMNLITEENRVRDEYVKLGVLLKDIQVIFY